MVLIWVLYFTHHTIVLAEPFTFFDVKDIIICLDKLSWGALWAQDWCIFFTVTLDSIVCEGNCDNYNFRFSSRSLLLQSNLLATGHFLLHPLIEIGYSVLFVKDFSDFGITKIIVIKWCLIELVDLFIISILNISKWLNLEKIKKLYYKKRKQLQPAACRCHTYFSSFLCGRRRF